MHATYAIFADGSHQYRVEEGDVIQIDFRDVLVGSTIEFDRVLLCRRNGDTSIGQPLVIGARVVAEVLGTEWIKTSIQKFKRRKNYRRRTGHRQPYTEVRIRSITVPQ
jgi:large subunit ribosomal protein L21